MTCSRHFFFSSRRRHTRCSRDWSSDVCSSDLVCSGFVGLRHEVVGLLQMVFLLLFEKLDFLSDGEKVFGLFVVAFVAVAADAPALAEKILAFTDHPEIGRAHV